MWIEKASAHRPLLVQMLLVALSRRICCSRVESVSTKPRLPSASTVSPHSRPGIWRTYFCLHPNSPTRSEEHTSELQSLICISYAVFCLKKKNKTYGGAQHRTHDTKHHTVTVATPQ